MKTITEDIELNFEKDLNLTVEYNYEKTFQGEWIDLLTITRKDGTDAMPLLNRIDSLCRKNKVSIYTQILNELEPGILV